MTDMPETSNAPAPAEWPRTYRASLPWRVFMVAGGTTLSAVGIWCIWYFGTGHEVRGSADTILMMSLSAFFVLLGSYSAGAALRERITLLPDAIEYDALFTTTRIERGEIAGYRFSAFQLNLFLGGPDRRIFGISLLFRPDAAFMAWLAAIGAPEGAEQVAVRKAANEDAAPGATPKDPEAHAGAARTVARLLNILAYGALVVSLAAPSPSVLALLALMPWLAIALCRRYGPACVIEEPANHTARGDLRHAILVPAVALGLRAMADVNLLDASPLLLPALPGGVFMAGVIAWVSPGLRRRPPRLGLYGAFLAAYVASVLALANTWLDAAPPRNFLATVISSQASHGLGAVQYYLEVSPWGPYPVENEIRVGRMLHHLTGAGQLVCIHVHPGALGLPWYAAGQAAECTSPQILT